MIILTFERLKIIINFIYKTPFETTFSRALHWNFIINTNQVTNKKLEKNRLTIKEKFKNI